MLAPVILLLATTLHLGPERPIQVPARDAQPGWQDVGPIAVREDTALVLWTDHGLRAVRVDRDGKTLDTTPLLLTEDFLEHSTVAAGPHGWLVAWSHTYGVSARLIAADGTVGPSTRIIRNDAPKVHDNKPILHAAFDGKTYLVVMEGPTAFTGARFSETGQPLAIFSITATGGRSIAGLHADPEGGFVLVAWQRDIDVLRLDDLGRVRSSRKLAKPRGLIRVLSTLDDAGQVVAIWGDGSNLYRTNGTSDDLLVVEGSPGASPQLQSVVRAGGTSFIVFIRDDVVVMKNIDTGNEREWMDDRRPMLAATASFGDRVLVATERRILAGLVRSQDAFMSVVDTAMEDVEPTRLLYVEPRHQFEPASAPGLVAWMEVASDLHQRLHARIASRDPILVAEDAYEYVHVASNGNGYLLLWRGYDLKLWVRHIRHDGSMNEPVQIPDSSTTAGDVCLTWTGSEYLAAYPRFMGMGQFGITGQVFMQLLTDEGALIGPAVALTERDYHVNVSCASSESSTLIAWGGINGSYAMLRTAGGSMSSPFYVLGTNGASVASNGSGFLLLGWGGWARVPVSDHGTPGTRIYDGGGYRQWGVGVVGGEYVLFTEDIDGPLQATPLDERGEVAGESVTIGLHTKDVHFAGSTLAYARAPTHALYPAQVFTRELSTSTKRRAVR